MRNSGYMKYVIDKKFTKGVVCADARSFSGSPAMTRLSDPNKRR